MLDKLLISLVHESSEVLFLVGRLAIGIDQLEYFLFDWENALQSVFPEILLLTLRYTTALLIADLNDLTKNVVKLLDVLIRTVHVL